MKQINDIYLDIDGVVLDFPQHFYNWFQEPYISPTKWNDPFIKAHFEEIINKPIFWSNLPNVSRPEDLVSINHLIKGYITAAPCQARLREDNLIKNGFIHKPVYTVGIHDSKVEICKQLNVDLFVDDKPQNFIELNRAGIPCILFNQTWNNDVNARGLRITNLNQIENIVQLEKTTGFLSTLSKLV